MSLSLQVVQASTLTQLLRDLHQGVEIWPDAEFHEGGYDYFWICSNLAGTVRNLAYVRVKPGSFEKRTYDKNGDDLWVDTE